MQIAVFGMGYVGVVSSACLARDGHTVIGVDTNPVKVDLVNEGKSPIIETGLEELIRDGVRSGRLRAVTDHRAAIGASEILLICVGTPGHPNGSLDLTYVKRVCEQIGEVIAGTDARKTVVIRSTMLPGSMDSTVLPALETTSGKTAGRDFGVCINPEFLREGSAIYDYDNPPKTIIGASDSRAAQTLSALYSHLDAPLHLTDLRTAEMVKYVDNAWHALKVTFANEVGRLSKAVGVDSRKVMELFCTDRKLNISSAYLRPGFAFGGSCLPKDVRALSYHGRAHDVETPVLNAIMASNQHQIDHALSMILGTGHRQVGFLGLSFKPGTDDLRESAIVTLAEQLIGKGYDLRIYDRNVKLASLFGANRDYILNRIPHISGLLVDEPAELFGHAQVIVVATAEREFREILRRHAADHLIFDLAGLADTSDDGSLGNLRGYEGIGW